LTCCSINIIVRIVTGVLQDQSPASNPYKKVTPVYVVLSVCSFAVAILMMIIYFLSKFSSSTFISNLHVDIGRLQWTRKQRIENGEIIKRRKRIVGLGDEERRERAAMAKFSQGAFSALILLVLGSWAAYFWGVATGHNS